MSYNGWRTFETWDVALWLSNDEGVYNLIQNFIKEHKDVEHLDYKLLKFIQDLVEDNVPEMLPSMYQDLLWNALEHVDYFEIVDSYLED